MSDGATMLAAKKTGAAAADVVSPRSRTSDGSCPGQGSRVRDLRLRPMGLERAGARSRHAGRLGPGQPRDDRARGRRRHRRGRDAVDPAALAKPSGSTRSRVRRVRHCRAGRQTFCARVTIVCQGFAEYVVAPARQCRAIPPGSTTPASMIGDMVGTPIGAVKRAAVAARRVRRRLGSRPGWARARAGGRSPARGWSSGSTRSPRGESAPNAPAPSRSSSAGAAERLLALTGGRGPTSRSARSRPRARWEPRSTACGSTGGW